MSDYFSRAMVWLVLGMVTSGFGSGTAAVLGLWWVWAIVVAIVALSMVMYGVNLQKGLRHD